MSKVYIHVRKCNCTSVYAYLFTFALPSPKRRLTGAALAAANFQGSLLRRLLLSIDCKTFCILASKLFHHVDLPMERSTCLRQMRFSMCCIPSNVSRCNFYFLSTYCLHLEKSSCLQSSIALHRAFQKHTSLWKLPGSARPNSVS